MGGGAFVRSRRGAAGVVDGRVGSGRRVERRGVAGAATARVGFSVALELVQLAQQEGRKRLSYSVTWKISARARQ